MPRRDLCLNTIVRLCGRLAKGSYAPSGPDPVCSAPRSSIRSRHGGRRTTTRARDRRWHAHAPRRDPPSCAVRDRVERQQQAPAVRAQPGRRRRPEHVPAVLRPAGGRPGRSPPPVAVPDAERLRPRGPADVAGHHLRRRRQRRQHARRLAGARHRRDHAQGLARGDRAGRVLGRRHLLVRRGNHGLVRPQAAPVHRRAGDAGRELLPALPLGGGAAAAVPAAGRRAARCRAGWPATTASPPTSSTTPWTRWSPTIRAGPATGSSPTGGAAPPRRNSRSVSSAPMGSAG